MNNYKTNSTLCAASMRAKAEMIVKAQQSNQPSVISLERAQFLLQELQVHQIELEMQNEELRRSHNQLAQAKDQHLDLYELAPIGYLTLDIKGKILQANLTAAILFALPKESLVNNSINTFIVFEDQDIFYHHTREVFESIETKSCELRFVRGAKTFWAHIESSAVKNSQEEIIWHFTLNDITLQKELEENLIIAKESCKHLVEFMSNMSRDIRTSLNGVIGLTDLLFETHLDPLQSDYLTKVQLAANRLLDSINSQF